MNKISARDILLFMAGAMALLGLQALIRLIYELTLSVDLSRVIALIIGGLALPIGICVLTGRRQAVLFAQIYLWLEVIAGCIVLPLYCMLIPQKARSFTLRTAPELLVAVALLWLIFWSRSRRFNPQSEPKVTTS